MASIDTDKPARHDGVPPGNVGDPLYVRTALAIRKMIMEDGLPAGAKIEPEHVLAGKLGVSRVTLRSALRLLVDEHILVQRHGVGTFVAFARLTYPLLGLHSTREVFRAHNVQAEARIVDARFAKPTIEERSRLHLPEGEGVYRFTRCDLVDGLPVCIAQCALPSHLARAIDRKAIVRVSTYELLERLPGIRLTHAHQLIRAEAASRRLASLLGIAPDSPVFILDRVTYDNSGIPVEWGLISYRHDRIEYSMELDRNSAGLHETATKVAIRYASGGSGRTGDGVTERS